MTAVRLAGDDEHSDEAFVARYLRRLDLPRSDRADDAQLRVLHAAHLEHVPFENLSIHLGEAVSLDAAALDDKVLRRNRGGFCYELNGLFGRLLRLLGYEVTLLGARVWGGETFGPPLDHLVLAVRTVGDAQWLVDVGFGDHSLYPLSFEEEIEQHDPAGVFLIRRISNGDWDLYRGDALQYRIESHPRELADFEGMCWYHQSSSRSHFTRSVVCSIRTTTGRLTLTGSRLITTTWGKKEETEVSAHDLLGIYRTLFGIELAAPPVVRARDTLTQ